MAISESQLETWSHLGSVTQSAATYAAVRRILESSSAPYAEKSYTVFLQGSYANDTNVYRESDVDVVIRTDSLYFDDTDSLTDADKALYRSQFTLATYQLADFARDVITQLTGAFGAMVKPGSKAIFIEADGTRREADVLACAQFRKYSRFRGWSDQTYDEGICFFRADGTRIINYPKQHSENCTRKHQLTNQWFKPTVRVLKNMRNTMVERGVLGDGVAPSYFLEGMLYNVPANCFGGSFASTFTKSMLWLAEADSTTLICANGEYYLLNDTSPVTWRQSAFISFLNAVLMFWNSY